MTLKPITILSGDMPECIALNVIPEKKEPEYIWTNAYMLGLQHWYTHTNQQPMACRAVYVNNQMIGLVTYNYFASGPIYNEPHYRIRPVMIDKDHAGKGLEAQALGLLLDEIRTKPFGEAQAVFATYYPAETDMAALYRDAGFVVTDPGADTSDNTPIRTRLALE
jgi:GNAT superfamily N-acetyltransferase